MDNFGIFFTAREKVLLLMMQNEFLKYFSQKLLCKKVSRLVIHLFPLTVLFSSVLDQTITSYSCCTKWVIEISSHTITIFILRSELRNRIIKQNRKYSTGWVTFIFRSIEHPTVAWRVFFSILHIFWSGVDNSGEISSKNHKITPPYLYISGFCSQPAFCWICADSLKKAELLDLFN